MDVNGHLGDVPFPNGRAGSYTRITRRMCGLLATFRRSPERPELACLAYFDWSHFHGDDPATYACSQRANDMAEALMTLAHESMHLRGWADEATAQCYGLQELAFTVERLGGSLAEGVAVRTTCSRCSRSCPRTTSRRECAAGRSLDLHPETPAFPTEERPGPPPSALFGPQL